MLDECAGVLFIDAAENVLLMRRVDAGHYWSLPGGHVESGETREQAALREAAEETGLDYGRPLSEWTRRQDERVDFTTYLAQITEPFQLALNNEHDMFTWVQRTAALELSGLHPGVKIALLRFDMDEADVARAMRIDELTSPQRFGNIMLVAMRVTGTGASFRPQHDEYVWRDPDLYLNEDFLERVQGLAVIVEHPDHDQLNGKEFRDRAVGILVMPYIKGTEVWGIAKIYDEHVAKLLIDKVLSTSPSVSFRAGEEGERIPLESGRHVLVESEPGLLDHLAIVEAGVWDKGGSATGIDVAGAL